MVALTFKKATSFYLSAEWATLDELALSLILDKLLEPIDHVRFAAVCKQWHSFIKGGGYRQARQRLLPLLMIPPPPESESESESDSQAGKRQVYSISEAKIYNNIDLSLPCYAKRCCGSSHGWLATVDQRLAITLHNPFQKAKAKAATIRLPPLDAVTIPIQNAPLYEYYVLKVVLSADPALKPDDYAVVVLCDVVTKLAFIKRGQTRWTYITTPLNLLILCDVIFYRDQIYAVGKWGDMVSLDFNSNNNSIVKTLEPIYRKFTCSAVGAYLVESTKGDLLHVRRVRFYGEGPNHGIRRHTRETFEVFKLVFNHQKNKSTVEHVQLRHIGGESFFVGDNHSVSVLASDYPQCHPNSIYFTDDLTFFRPLKPLNEGPCDELNWYLQFKKSIHYTVSLDL